MNRRLRRTRWLVNIAGWIYKTGDIMLADWLTPAYICVNGQCDEVGYVLCTSMSDPLCDVCGSVLEEVEVEGLVESGAPPVEDEG